jgi:hypothetical protein
MPGTAVLILGTFDLRAPAAVAFDGVSGAPDRAAAESRSPPEKSAMSAEIVVTPSRRGRLEQVIAPPTPGTAVALGSATFVKV